MADLEELAGRVEGLSGPDDQIDALIRCAVFAPPNAYVKQSPINGAWCIYELGHGGRERSWEPRGLSREQRLGSFTASIDAAMTLVPTDFDWTLGSSIVEGCLATIPAAYGLGDAVHGFARSPALALTAAALRSRTQGNPNG